MDRKTFIYSTATGIVAIIVFSYLLEPLSLVAWHLITSASNFIFAKIQDDAVSNAAIGKRDWIMPIFVCWLAAASWGCFIGFLIATVFKRNPSKKNEGMTSKHLLFIWTSLIFWVLVLTNFGFTTYVDLQMNASFSQRMDALAPYIDDQQAKQLRSKWAVMETLADYRTLTSQMDELAVKAGVKLPKVLYR